MPCFHPLDAWQCANGDVVFVDNLQRNNIVRSLSLPCGRCVGCRLERSRQWAVRCMHEASLYDFSSFVTLTYNDDNLPPYNSLVYSDFQKFMKRLRKRFSGVPIRFYMCGEYGEENLRPHYHVCLFNCFFPDRRKHSVGNTGSAIYTSKILDALWPVGFASIGDVTFESAAYCARYIMQKVTGDLAEAHYTSVDLDTGEISKRVPEFNKMSLKPGIGAGWFERFKSDVYPKDHVIIRGFEAKPPRFYDKLLQKVDADMLEDVQFSRYSRAMLNVKESFPDRLAVREAVVKSRLSSLSRSL